MVQKIRDSAGLRTREVTARRHNLPGVDTALQLYERDEAIHGSIFASAVAFRLFLWMLPLTLVIVAGLGFIRTGGGSRRRR